MNAYSLNLLALIAALLGQAVAGGLALECALRPRPPRLPRRLWLALAGASLMLGLHHGYSIELALKTGLYDLSQSLLGGGAGLLYAIAVISLSRRASGRWPR